MGYTYRWNKAQTDAVLVGSKGMDVEYEIKDPKAPGGVRKQVWHYPSRNECMFCHSRAAGFVFGFTTQQMNRTHQFRGRQAGQPASDLRSHRHLQDPTFKGNQKHAVLSGSLGSPRRVLTLA